MPRNSLLLQTKRLRRNIWPAQPGTSRSAVYDALLGLVLLVGLAIRFPTGEYSYLIQAARNPVYRTGGTLAWVTLLTSLGLTSFLIGSPIRNTLSRLFYYFVPRSWRSLTYRRLTERTVFEPQNQAIRPSRPASVIEQPMQSDPEPVASKEAEPPATTIVETRADLSIDENK